MFKVGETVYYKNAGASTIWSGPLTIVQIRPEAICAHNKEKVNGYFESNVLTYDDPNVTKETAMYRIIFTNSGYSDEVVDYNASSVKDAEEYWNNNYSDFEPTDQDGYDVYIVKVEKTLTRKVKWS